jgi:hypothetical protein
MFAKKSVHNLGPKNKLSCILVKQPAAGDLLQWSRSHLSSAVGNQAIRAKIHQCHVQHQLIKGVQSLKEP